MKNIWDVFRLFCPNFIEESLNSWYKKKNLYAYFSINSCSSNS